MVLWLSTGCHKVIKNSSEHTSVQLYSHLKLPSDGKGARLARRIDQKDLISQCIWWIKVLRLELEVSDDLVFNVNIIMIDISPMQVPWQWYIRLDTSVVSNSFHISKAIPVSVCGKQFSMKMNLCTWACMTACTFQLQRFCCFSSVWGDEACVVILVPCKDKISSSNSYCFQSTVVIQKSS